MLKIFHLIPVALKNKFFVYCPIHVDSRLTKVHDFHGSGRTFGQSRGLCEECVKMVFKLKGCIDGCSTSKG